MFLSLRLSRVPGQPIICDWHEDINPTVSNYLQARSICIINTRPTPLNTRYRKGKDLRTPIQSTEPPCLSLRRPRLYQIRNPPDAAGAITFRMTESVSATWSTPSRFLPHERRLRPRPLVMCNCTYASHIPASTDNIKVGRHHGESLQDKDWERHFRTLSNTGLTDDDLRVNEGQQ